VEVVAVARGARNIRRGFTATFPSLFVYYEEIKRELNTILISPSPLPFSEIPISWNRSPKNKII
jgi:hypothetical protein